MGWDAAVQSYTLARSRVAASQLSQSVQVGARVGGRLHHRASSVGCPFPMPALLGLLGLLPVACWPARPLAARCVSRSWFVTNPAN